MKSFLRTFLLAGVPAGVFWGFYFGSDKGLSSAVWSGITAGFVLGFAAAVIARTRQNRVADSSPILTDEVLLRKGRADYDGMVGWLYLTNRRLLFEGYPTDETAPEISTLFEGHRDDAPAHELSIPIHEISDAVVSQPFGIMGRLDVILEDGRTKHFGTEDLTEWVDDISTVRQNYLDEPRSESHRLFQ